MNQQHPSLAIPDPWSSLRKFTDARIALGRCGSSLPLKESLKFKLAHAQARDAVHQQAGMTFLAQQLEAGGFTTLQLASSVAERMEYLTRPDKGRCLDDQSKKLLEKQQPKGFDIGIIICDGLSAPAIDESAFHVAHGLLNLLKRTHLTVAPVCLVHNGRVAIGDEISSIAEVKISLVLIGERPGLSSPNSLGIYLTYTPSPGTTDENRNCISNIRPGGLTAARAVQKAAYLIEMSGKQKQTGVRLKDRMPEDYQPLASLMSR